MKAANPLKGIVMAASALIKGAKGFFRGAAGIGSRALSGIRDFFRSAGRKASRVNAFLSPSFLVPPKAPILVVSMALVSALVLAVEAAQFNMLLLVSNYVKATSIISIAMLGIAVGGFLAFALAKANPVAAMSVAALLLFGSLALSYMSLVDFAAIGFPYYLVLPYLAASFIVSSILAQSKSTLAYFANLAGSAIGAVLPLVLVPLLKSEGTMLAFLVVPAALLLLFSLMIRNVVVKAAVAALAVLLGAGSVSFIARNAAYPDSIPQEIFEGKILAEMAPIPGEKPSVNFAAEFLKRTYVLDPGKGAYEFSSDEYDWKRARAILGVLGFAEREGMKWMSAFERRPYLADARSVPRAVFENEILRAASRRYGQAFSRDYDLAFLRSAYELKDGSYVLSKDRYARQRAKLLLSDLGHFGSVDLALDLRRNGRYDDGGKSFNGNARIVLDEDSTVGRVQYTRSGDRYNMAINGVLLDNMDQWDGNYYDPRIPFLENAKVFIVGLSADGIPKSAKLHPGAKVYGVELNPTIWRTMTDGGFYQTFSSDPYENVVASKAEGRSWLERTDERFDIIFLMNIHQDMGTVANLGPENFHTVEATRMMLDRLTDRGMIVLEEILMGRRSELFFMKMMNTLKTALRESGQERPELCIHVSKWDFWGGDAFRTVSVKKSPFTPAEVAAQDAYLAKSKATGYYGALEVIYDPLAPGKNPIDAFIRGEDVLSLRELPPKAPTQDFARRVLSRAADPRDADLALRFYKHGGDGYDYLRAAGMTQAERYRLEAAMEAAGYSLDIDLSPVRDDSPFPFNVYAKKTEATDVLRDLLPIALLLAAPLLVILLRSVKEYRVSIIPPVAFAAISGFAYMLVEIVLMQKFQLFIGDPTLSLILVLGGMLLFSGLGSFVSGFLPKKALVAAAVVIPLLLGLYGWKIDSWFEALAFLRGAGRPVAAVLLIMPLTFLMGMPFPNALEAIKAKTSPDFASLLFGVNGLTSTLGSATAFILNVSRGYAFSFAVGALCYAAAMILFAFFMRRAEPGRAAP